VIIIKTLGGVWNSSPAFAGSPFRSANRWICGFAFGYAQIKFHISPERKLKLGFPCSRYNLIPHSLRALRCTFSGPCSWLLNLPNLFLDKTAPIIYKTLTFRLLTLLKSVSSKVISSSISL